MENSSKSKVPAGASTVLGKNTPGSALDVDLIWPVINPAEASRPVHEGQRGVVSEALGAKHLDGAVADVVEHVSPHHLDDANLNSGLIAFVDLLSSGEGQQPASLSQQIKLK